MAARRIALLSVALVTSVLVLSSMGLLAMYSGGPGLAGASPGSPAPAAAAPPSHGPSPIASPVVHPTTLAASSALTSSPTLPYGISEVEQEIASGKVNRSAALLPRAPSSAIPAPGTPITGPSYPGLPAPMGLSDLGLGSNGPYEYNTSSFAASLDLASFQDYNPGYSAWQTTPDWMTFQLNTVTVNVSYPGASNGSFWIQNVVHFNGTTLQFEDNIWNFSQPHACLNPGTLLNYSGQQDGCFYYVYGPTFTVSYPLSLTLYNNITISNWGPSPVPDVFFNYTLSDPSGTYSGSFDNVTFNGLASPSAPPEFEVNGFNYAPIGYLFWDAEIIFGGNGGGANANIVQLAATAELQYWNASTDRYQNVSSAYDYGEDTGETSLGVAASYTGATETLVQGPSQLYGLWNTSGSLFGPAASPGSIDLTIQGVPSTGFAFVANETSWDASGDLNASYWPAEPNGSLVTELPPPAVGDGYVTEILASGFEPNITAPLTASGVVSITMTPASGTFDTPVYLSNDAEVAAFGSYGLSGVTYLDGNLWINDTQITVATPFNLVNDFAYPTFVLFAALNLSDNVSIDDFGMSAASFLYHGVRGMLEIPGWSQGYYFNFGGGIFDVSNVSIIGNSSLYYVVGTEPLASVEFWSVNGENASNILATQDDFGVDAYYSNDVSLFNLTSETGANAAVVYEADGVNVVDLAANGTDYPGPILGLPTYGLILEDVEGVDVQGLTATNDALGLYTEGVEDFFFEDISVSDADQVISPYSPYAAPGIYLDDIGYGDLLNVQVNDSLGFAGGDFGFFGFENLSFTGGAVAGTLYYSDLTEYLGVSASDSDGLVLVAADEVEAFLINASGLDAVGGSASGLELEDSSDVFLTNISSTDGAIGAVTEEGSDVTADNITSATGAFGFGGLEITDLSIANISASDGSVGAVVDDSDGVLAANVTVSGIGAGLGIGYSDDVFVTNVSSTAATPGPEYYSSSDGGIIPNTPVASMDNDGETVANVSAYNAGFGFQDNGTLGLLAENLTSWYAGIGVSLNGTDEGTIASAFLYGSGTGAWLFNTTDVELTASTVEGSASYGVAIEYGLDVSVLGNNFVANNGASTDGVFVPGHVQASAVLAAGVLFNESGVGNYWSDWVISSGPYVIAAGVADFTPVGAFISNWLEFSETGLRAGTEWGFTLGSIDYRTIAPVVFIPSWSLGDPTLSYTVQAPVGYTPTPPSGTVPYVGANYTVMIVFSAIPYTVTFTESGLASGVTWSVTLNGTLESNTTTASGGAIVFSDIVSAMYDYTVGAVANYTGPHGGTVTVSGSNARVGVAFTLVTYTVTFTESGLASGTTWWVTIGSNNQSSTTATVVFALANGSYSYTIGTVTGFVATPASGTFSVMGMAVDTPISFAAIPVTTYTVTFTESGLPSGTSWSVTLNGVTKTAAAGSSIVFTGVANGTVSYSIGAVSGYSASPSTGSVTVQGANKAVSVSFASTSTSTSSSGLSPLDWAIIGIVIALIVIGVVVALARRGRRGPSSTTPSSGTSSTGPTGAAGGSTSTPGTEPPTGGSS